jgi:predicted SAM-dependent methyltransferase
MSTNGIRTLARGLIPPVLLRLALQLKQTTEAAVARRRLAGCDRLHLACGSNIIEGWGNVCLAGTPEVVKYDLTRPLPVPTGSVRLIYTEHFIEHITREQAVAFLGECRRVLAPGGVIRISTPSLEKVIESYTADTGQRQADDHTASPCRRLNDRMRGWGHRFLYDRPELEALLVSCGFVQVTIAAWRQSARPELANLECRPDHGEIILEAEK